MKKPSIGVVAISYNEERDLPGFIDNLNSWVDEIVIVDDGSTDQTQAISEAHDKVHFIHAPRAEGAYYADQRNKGIDAAHSQWLLHMDIDERVPTALKQEILQTITEQNKKAYKYRRINYFLHRPMKGGGWANWNLVHLAQRDVLRFSGMFHEKIDLSCKDQEVGQLKNPMIHLNDESYVERLSKSNNYQFEVANAIRNSGKKLTTRGLIWSFLREFISKYIVKSGYRDGAVGILSAMHSATAAFRAYAIVWDEQNAIPRETLEKKLDQQG